MNDLLKMVPVTASKTLRLLLSLLLLTVIFRPAHAVLQEKDLDLTVKMLYADLSVLRDNVQKKVLAFFSSQNQYVVHLRDCGASDA